jgi:hypothetical protein
MNFDTISLLNLAKRCIPLQTIVECDGTDFWLFEDPYLHDMCPNGFGIAGEALYASLEWFIGEV